MITSSGAPKVWLRWGQDHGVGVKPQAANEFLQFSHKKHILAHFFVEQEHVVSRVIMDNAIIFLQLMSKSRNLAKISKRRLQPLLV